MFFPHRLSKAVGHRTGEAVRRRKTGYFSSAGRKENTFWPCDCQRIVDPFCKGIFLCIVDPDVYKRQGHRPHAAGYRGNVGGFFRHRPIVYIAAELPRLVAVHSHIENHGSLLHHSRRDDVPLPDSGHQDIRSPADLAQISGAGMADCDLSLIHIYR